MRKIFSRCIGSGVGMIYLSHGRGRTVSGFTYERERRIDSRNHPFGSVRKKSEVIAANESIVVLKSSSTKPTSTYPMLPLLSQDGHHVSKRHKLGSSHQSLSATPYLLSLC